MYLTIPKELEPQSILVLFAGRISGAKKNPINALKQC